MAQQPVFIVSDIHLGAVPQQTERAFRRFLGYAAESASALLINGDLFDFWFEYGSVVPSEHFRVLARLADVVEAGLPVWFVGGNHDAWGGRFLAERVGLQLIDGTARMELAGRRALVAHGDGVGSGDLGYRMLRRVLRHPLSVRAFRALHPDLGRRLADRASSTDGKLHAEGTVNRGRAAFLRDWAREQLRADASLQMVVTGHAHVPAVEQIEPGRWYINSGDWVHHFTYVRLPADEGPPELHRWEPEGREEFGG